MLIFMTKIKIYNKDSSLETQTTITSNKNMLDEMLDQGSQIIFGCFGGSCGSCKCEILKGEELIEKEAIRPIVLKGLNDNEFLPCISKIKESENEEIEIRKCL